MKKKTSRTIIEKNNYEMSKFHEDKDYHFYVNKLLKSNIPPIDFLHQFPAYTGKVNLSRFLSLYELYKKVSNLKGHISEIGVWKGASLLFLAKLVSIFEPYSNTIVHGFDNFMGMKPSNDEVKKGLKTGSYKSDYHQLKKIVKLQKLDGIVKIHKLDVTKDLKKFSNVYKSTVFKLIFFDAGVYEVLNKSLPFFWDRLVKGGVIIFDQFNYECAFGETRAVREILNDRKIETINWSRTPSAFITK